ncbi:REC8 meiotic recombination protein b isoform X1 [Gadus macrocephalus]|uniref:REC8 meiotic recombination protein b isoform X1 n=1 Tax=Gadus macrocephalus TaxID=80720 RepID=UPI0028CB5909|nr:REC8 meiotic recombination protein b isoform X1 [Gadus macrocephalus]
MFYYPNVLHRHTGCFSTIWLAATKGIKMNRRELMKVNVGRTCQDIMDYVLVRVPPPTPDLPKPRFSLYLSSQLQYGVVIVYHNQCRFLLEDSQQTVERLFQPTPWNRIDIAESDRLTLDVPDNLFLMEGAEGAQDPFFGLMRADQLPSPYKIQQPKMLTQDTASQHSLLASPLIASNGFSLPAAVITLREKEQLGIHAAECFEGAELPEATAKELDMLMDQQDQFCEAVEEQERERAATVDTEGARISIDKLKETVSRADTDSVWILDDETGQPFAVPLATLSREMTPPTAAVVDIPPEGSSGRGRGSEKGTEPVAESSTGGEADAPPRRGRRGCVVGGRRRQLVFADAEVQISEPAMRRQLENLLAETLSPAEMLLPVHFLAKSARPDQLFSTPSSVLYHPDLLSLWKQGSHLVTLPHSGHDGRLGGEEEEEVLGSEQDRETLRRRRRESSFREIPRHSAEPGLQLTDASSVSDVPLDVSRGDKSHSDIVTPASRWSPQGEVQDLMQPIAEEYVEMPELPQTHAQSGDLSAPDLLRLVSFLLQRIGQVTFDTLLPPEASRSHTAHTLSKLLELVSSRELMVQQRGPYSTILITQPEPNTHTHTHTQNP